MPIAFTVFPSSYGCLSCVIGSPTQASRTLIGFLLNCQSDLLRPLIAPALDGLRYCVGLLRRFSDRYVCGQRSCDMMEEVCRRMFTY